MEFYLVDLLGWCMCDIHDYVGEISVIDERDVIIRKS